MRKAQASDLIVLSELATKTFVIKCKPPTHFDSSASFCNMVDIAQDVIIDEIGNEAVQRFRQ